MALDWKYFACATSNTNHIKQMFLNVEYTCVKNMKCTSNI